MWANGLLPNGYSYNIIQSHLSSQLKLSHYVTITGVTEIFLSLKWICKYCYTCIAIPRPKRLENTSVNSQIKNLSFLILGEND